MAFRNSRYTDARGGVFNDVGRDQIHHTTINIISLSSSGTICGQLLRNDTGNPALPISLETLTQGNSPIPTHHFDAGSARDIAAHLILEIVQALKHPDSSDNYRGLELELGSLKQMLTLSGLAIQAYAPTPLGRNLTKSFNEATERCLGVLQELLVTINNYRRCLDSTPIHHLWHRVGCDPDKVAYLRMKLSIHQNLLAKYLKALDS